VKAYKIEILVIDHDKLGWIDTVSEIQNARFPNDCLNLIVKSVSEKDIGEWSDDHPLNKAATCEAEYKRLFSNEAQPD